MNQFIELQSEYSNNFREIIQKKIPLLDLRAPVEFLKGAFSQSVNKPLMLDDERAAVGICYKNKGQEAAIDLGHQLISGQIKQQRIEQWQQFVSKNKQGYLYCFRGGLRSKTVQQWLAQSGFDYPLIEGGYKAMRQFLINELEKLALHPFYIVGGNTGCGKTRLLSHCNSLDLEGAAEHRGSSFGGFVKPQATQINFENNLAEQYICGHFSPHEPIILEDEGRMIGGVHLPEQLRNAMKRSPIIIIEEDFQHRLEQLFQEYVIQMLADYTTAYGIENGFEAFSHYLKQGLFKVQKRLGSQRYHHINQLLIKALAKQVNGDMKYHFDWLSLLVKEYYDPMYEYQLALKMDRVIFRGNNSDCLDFIRSC